MASGRHSIAHSRSHKRGKKDAGKEAEANQVYERRLMLGKTLDRQLVEAQVLLAQHTEKTKALLAQEEDALGKLQVENLELRAQIQRLGAATYKSDISRIRSHQLSQQHSRTLKVVVQRDKDARLAEQENAELREALAASSHIIRSEASRTVTGNSVSTSLDSEAAFPASHTAGFPLTPREQPPVLAGWTLPTANGIPGTLPSGSEVGAPETSADKAKAVMRLDRANSKMSKSRSSTKQEAPVAFDLYKEMKLADQVSNPLKLAKESQEDADGDDDSFQARIHELEAKLKERKEPMRQTKMLDMKERLRSMAVRDSTSHTHRLYKETGIARAIATSAYFDNLVTGVILINLIWLGLDTAFNDSDLLVDADIGWIVADNLFCLFFTIEAMTRFLAFSKKANCFQDRWFIFDAMVCVLVALDSWVLFPIMLLTGQSFAIVSPSLVRLIRLMKLTRVARIVRLMRAFPELMVLLRGVAIAARSVIATVSLYATEIYTFSIIFTQLCKDTRPGEEFFSCLGCSAFTLIFGCSFGDESAAVAKSLFEEHFLLGALLVLFILFAPLTVMNMLIGVLVEVIRVVAATEQDTMAIEYVSHVLYDGLMDIDKDGNKSINANEFSNLLSSDRCLQALREIGVDPWNLLESAPSFFSEDEEISYHEFVDIVMSFRGNNPVTVSDMINYRKQLLDEINLALDDRFLKQMKAFA